MPAYPTGLDQIITTFSWPEKDRKKLYYYSNGGKRTNEEQKCRATGDINGDDLAFEPSAAAALLDFELLVALCTVERELKISTQLSLFLQKQDIDLMDAKTEVKDVLTRLQQFKNQSGAFSSIFKKATDLRATHFAEPPMLPGRQMRENRLVTSEDVEHHLKGALFVPFVELLEAEINRRFISKESAATIALGCLVPKFLPGKQYQDFAPVVEQFKGFLKSDGDVLEDEFAKWQGHWERKREAGAAVPANALDSFNNCNSDFFPNIKDLLQIFATMPVSTASPERSFSTLRMTKTYLRNGMTDERLNGISMMYVHTQEDGQSDP